MKASTASRKPAATPRRAPDVDVQDAVFEALSVQVEAVRPPRPAALRKRVLEAVERDVAAARAVTTVAASAEGFAELLPGVHAKRVYTDGTAESWLVRLQPGARAPAHDHPGAEECVVLEGSIRYVGGSVLRAGDFEAVAPGGRHSELVSDTGALVFLRYTLPLSRYIAF